MLYEKKVNQNFKGSNIEKSAEQTKIRRTSVYLITSFHSIPWFWLVCFRKVLMGRNKDGRTVAIRMISGEVQ